MARPQQSSPEVARGDRIRYALRLLACVLASVLAHLLLSRGAALLPEQAPAGAPRTVIQVQLIAPPPLPPEPQEVPEPEAPPPEEVPPPEVPIVPPPEPPQPVHHHHHAVVTQETPPSERARPDADPSAVPLFGIPMESTSQAGTGPSLPVGNTTQMEPAAHAPTAPADALAEPVAAYEVTRMPVPVGRCTGHYTDEARAAGVEGTVVLDLVVGPDGRARDITVVEGLGHGLTDAAIAALRRCRFTPGEHDGTPVAVRIRSFRITFLLQDGP